MFNHKYMYEKMTLTAASYNNKVTVELPLDASSEEMFHAFRTLMIGLTYPPTAFDNEVATYYFDYGLGKHYNLDKVEP